MVLGNEVTGVDVELLSPLLGESDRLSCGGGDEPHTESSSEGDETITPTPAAEAEATNQSLGGPNSKKETLVDVIVELPTHGQKNSLNVAAVAPVILYEILRQWE